jgi:hypothetical protein
MFTVLSLIVNELDPLVSPYTVPFTTERLITTPFARIVSEQLIVLASITVFAAVTVHGPV